jgi:PAS domain-containing protein
VPTGADRDDARAELAVALAQSERERAFLNCLYDAIPDLVWVKDMNGVYLIVQSDVQPALQRAASTISSAAPITISSARNWPISSAHHDRAAIEAGQAVINEEWLNFGDGYHGLFETIKTPMHDHEGNLIGILGIARDITERRRVEEALRASETELARHREQLETLVAERTGDLARAMPVSSRPSSPWIGSGSASTGSTRRWRILTYVNQVAAGMLGYTVEEMLRSGRAGYRSGVSAWTVSARAHCRYPLPGPGISIDTRIRHRDGRI